MPSTTAARAPARCSNTSCAHRFSIFAPAVARPTPVEASLTPRRQRRGAQRGGGVSARPALTAREHPVTSRVAAAVARACDGLSRTSEAHLARDGGPAPAALRGASTSSPVTLTYTHTTITKTTVVNTIRDAPGAPDLPVVRASDMITERRYSTPYARAGSRENFRFFARYSPRSRRS